MTGGEQVITFGNGYKYLESQDDSPRNLGALILRLTFLSSAESRAALILLSLNFDLTINIQVGSSTNLYSIPVDPVHHGSSTPNPNRDALEISLMAELIQELLNFHEYFFVLHIPASY